MAQLDWYIRANLKPRHLQILVALDDLRNLGKVALSLHVSQPAISLTLGDMERGLGLKLFERNARGVQPTVYGECLIRQARIILASLAQARDELHSLISGSSGRTTLGALPATTPFLVPQAVMQLKSHSPNTTVAVHEGSMETLLPSLRRGNIDLIVGRLLNDRSVADDLDEKILFEGSSSLVVRSDHRLAGQAELSWQHLQEYPWVLPPLGSIPREPLEVALQHNNVSMPANAIETLSTNVIVNCLQSTDSIGFLSRVVALHYCHLGILKMLPLALPNVLRPIGITWRRDVALSPSSLQLIAALEQTSANLSNTRIGH
jgi:DNA-binding transcriptional LysR family regulator